VAGQTSSRTAIKAYLGVYKAVGGWILARIVDGFKVVTDLLKSIGGWVLNRIVDFIKLEIGGLQGGRLVGAEPDRRRLQGRDEAARDGRQRGSRTASSTSSSWRSTGSRTIGSWIVNRVVDGFKTVTKALGTVGGWIKNRIVDFITVEADGFKNVGSTIIGWIVDGFKGGVNLLVDLVNKVIDVINVIPGIPNIKHVGHIGGSKPHGGAGGPNGTGKLAKGGMVPGSGYGDKVPLHIAGKLAAMVEPGELVSVANRNATAALMSVNRSPDTPTVGSSAGSGRRSATSSRHRKRTSHSGRQALSSRVYGT
jgi:hypothetical protein